ncbi:MAG: glycine C-acetyltransferase [Chloroflexota bacterium]|nr:glycine C-acetyltransferase [Chloroflexota bacterium]
MTTANDNLAWLDAELTNLEESGRYTHIRTLDSPQGAWLVVDGKEVLNFCSNNYLGLANHPRIIQAAREAIGAYGVGPAAVRTIAGTMTLHEDLERKLAEFKGAQAAITFQSGFSANIGTIPALIGKTDLIISDALNHASIIDGVRLTKASRAIYKHCDMASLREVLEANAGRYERMFIITDGVFSMDGDIAPLDQIVTLAEEFGALTIVDDAHGEGVLGRGGRGIVDHFDLHGRVDVDIGTLSKAFGAVGGVVAGSQTLVNWLKQRGRPFLFSSAMTVPDVAACIAAVDILSESTALVDRLWENGRAFQAEMQKLGFDTGKTQTPITPVMLGDELLAQAFSRRLYEQGVFGTAITFPTVPRGLARIRVMISAAHSQEDLETGLAVFARVGRELAVIQ